MRRHLSWLVAGWLLCQASALAAAPFVLHATGASAPGGFVVCDCPGAQPGQACPMHHPDHAAPKPGGFLLQNPCAPTSAALLFLAGSAGVPAVAPVASGLVVLSDRPLQIHPAFIAHIDVPDSPPPRA